MCFLDPRITENDWRTLALRADREQRTVSNYVRLHLRNLLLSDTSTAVR
jgi:hypothetical protein